jgi:hypothetical protein
VSISSTFFARFFVKIFCTKPNVTRKKLPKRRSYKKRTKKTLIKLTEGLVQILSQKMVAEIAANQTLIPKHKLAIASHVLLVIELLIFS